MDLSPGWSSCLGVDTRILNFESQVVLRELN